MSSLDSASKFSRYRQNLRQALSNLHILRDKTDDSMKVREIIDLAERYLIDGEYFMKKGDVETALISLAYSEGLLDSLRLLEYIHFKWIADRTGSKDEEK